MNRSLTLFVFEAGILLVVLSCNAGKRAVNAPCETNTACASEICHAGICAASSPAKQGTPCTGNGEYISFRCERGECQRGNQNGGTKCRWDEMCQSKQCLDGICTEPRRDGDVDGGTDGKAAPDHNLPDLTATTCLDKQKNGDETDTDCGGKTCPKCKDAMPGQRRNTAPGDVDARVRDPGHGGDPGPVLRHEGI